VSHLTEVDENYYRQMGFKKDVKFFMSPRNFGETSDMRYLRLLMLEGFLNRPDISMEKKIKVTAYSLDLSHPSSHSAIWYASDWIKRAQKYNITSSELPSRTNKMYSRIVMGTEFLTNLFNNTNQPALQKSNKAFPCLLCNYRNFCNDGDEASLDIMIMIGKQTNMLGMHNDCPIRQK
jgi:hypothetical protein